MEDEDSIRQKLSRSIMVYPRKRLVFNDKQRVHTVFLNDEKLDFSYRHYIGFGYLPSFIYSLCLVMKFDLEEIVHYFLISGLFVGGVVNHRMIKRKYEGIVKHMLISKNYEDIYIGYQDLASREDEEEVIVWGMRDGLKYKRIPLDRVLFIGDREVYKNVEKGQSLKESLKQYEEKKKGNEDKVQFKKIINEFSAFDSGEECIVIVAYDASTKEYIDYEINLGFNELSEYNDYITSLKNKNKIKFHTE